MKTRVRAAGNRVNGFTLIEMLVTLALVAVLLTLAVPSFQAFKRSSEVTSAANTFVSALALARGEAMKRGSTTTVQPLVDGDWSKGWRVFVDRRQSDKDEPDETDVLAKSEEALPSYLSMTSTKKGPLMFNGSGFSMGSTPGFHARTFEVGATDVTGPEQLAQTRLIILSSAGRVRVCTPKSANDSNCKVED